MTAAGFETVVRGIPLWLLRQYLQELGGSPGAEGVLFGDGWQARLAQAEDYVIGSVRVGQVRLALSGRPEAVAALERGLAPKLLRAGG